MPISLPVNDPKNDDEGILKPIEPVDVGPRGPDAQLPLG